MSRSPFILTYSDLITSQKSRVRAIEYEKELAIRNGQNITSGLIKKLECAKRILKLLEKSNRDYQTDLFSLNTELNRR